MTIAAHRLSTVRKADKIVVLDKGAGCGASVVEEGTHEELASRAGGLYAALVKTQTDGSDYFSSRENISIARQFSRELSYRDQSILALKAEYTDFNPCTHLCHLLSLLKSHTKADLQTVLPKNLQLVASSFPPHLRHARDK